MYHEDVAACKAAAPMWESAWKLMAGQGGQQWVGMGRVHWSHQRNMVNWIFRVGELGG